MDLQFSARARPYFELAGFQLPRNVAVHPAVPCDHPAYSLLARLGGIHIGLGPDNEILDEIRNDVVFEYYRYVGEWERLLDTKLIGVAETHQRHGLLVVAEDERFFTISGMHDAMGFVGCGFSDAMDNLLFAQSAPMIRPDQEFVKWYGIKYRHGDPGRYSYDSP